MSMLVLYWYHKVLTLAIISLGFVILGLLFSPDFTREAVGAAVVNAKPVGGVIWQIVTALKNIFVGGLDIIMR